MALVWTGADGEEGAQVWVQASALGSVRMVLLEMVPGTPLPDGDVDAQPLLWSPAGENSWVPGLDMRCNTVSALDDGLLALVGGTNGAQLSAQGTASVQMIGPGNAVTLAEIATSISVSAVQRLMLASDGSPVLDINDDGTRPGTLSFFGKLPTVARQSVDGDTVPEQLASIVAALTALGLTDDNTVAVPGPFITLIRNSALPSMSIEAIPAAAPSGYYAVSLSLNIRSPVVGGTWTVTATFTSAGGIASSLSLGALQAGAAGAVPTASSVSRVVQFGTGTAFNFNAVAAGIGGSPDYDISAVATYLGPIPPP